MYKLRPLFTNTLSKSLIASRVIPAVQARTLAASVSESTLPATTNTISSPPSFLPKSEHFKKDLRAETLYATLPFINEYGWSNESLIHGVRSLGYPSVAHGTFPGGEAGLIDAYLIDQRQKFADLVKEKYLKGDLEGLTTNERVLLLTSLRLKMNRPYIKKWPEALAIMARPSNVRMSMKHLADIADDIWYYAGDRSPDMNWYAKRASLAAIYSAAELVMIKDSSPEYTTTQRFLKRRLKEASIVGASRRQLTNMLYFGAKAVVNGISNIRK